MGRFVVLVAGLPGSGKTTFATALSNELGAMHVNADSLRKLYNDWDFSREGRLRQAMRMRDWCSFGHQICVCDFVAALREQRQILNPSYVVWMDTIKEGRYEDTNKAFEPLADEANYIIRDWNYDVHDVAKQILLLNR